MRKHFVPVILLLCFFSFSCGYSTHSTLPGHLRTIYIEPVKNAIGYSTESTHRNIYIPLLEVKVRNSVTDRFLFDGTLKTTQSEKADLVLRAELKDYDRNGLRYTDNNDVQEYRINITVSLELFDTRNQVVVWREPSFSGEATYFVSGPQAKSEDTAIQDATLDLARRIVERTIEDW